MKETIQMLKDFPSQISDYGAKWHNTTVVLKNAVNWEF